MSDWQAVADPDSGATYYYNAATGETQWEAPEGFGEAASSADGASAGGGGWTAHVDESSGATYYFNAGTGETTWELPAEMQEAEVASQTSSSRRSTMNRKSVMQKRAQATKSSKPQTVAEKLAARSKRFIQMRKAERAGSKAAAFASAGNLMRSASVVGPAATAAAPAEEAGESPWQAVVDEDSGATYYYNAESGETTWDAPPGFA